MRGLRQTPVHLELFSDRREMFTEVGEIFIVEINVEVFGIELDAHQEESGFLVGVFVSVQDVAVVAVDEIGNGGYFAFLVWAGDEKNGGVFHLLPDDLARDGRKRYAALVETFRIEGAELSVPYFSDNCRDLIYIRRVPG